MHTSPIIVWFRQDLRLLDNPALHAAAENGHILPIYILDDDNAQDEKMGGASRWWLHHSLIALDQALKHHLSVYQGDAKTVLFEIAQKHQITDIYWNRCYEPWRINRDQMIKKQLSAQGITCCSFNSALLWEPWQVLKKDATPYKVFTPFYKHCRQAVTPRAPLPVPDPLQLIKDHEQKLSIADLQLLPKIDWSQSLRPHWDIGSIAAQQKLEHFIEHELAYYQEERNFPAKQVSSRLSPHLHFGEISPNQIWYAVQAHGIAKKLEKNIDAFLRELSWREFAYHLLYHFPALPHKNLQAKFDSFPWEHNPDALKRWQKGLTGYPLVDAGMRQLWQTGYMHNRLRLVTGSFLVKNLLLAWQEGEAWFWDCLVDADMADNSMNWQWVAGCGVDAAPFFRIFNPVTQGKKFDPQGKYVRKFVPELAQLPDQYLFCPWEAPQAILEKAGITLGKDYPEPIVDLSLSRERALAAFASLSKSN
jgi:deoxyribodipyrimidine photo-lyase